MRQGPAVRFKINASFLLTHPLPFLSVLSLFYDFKEQTVEVGVLS